MAEAEEAAKISKAHQTWMVELLQAKGGECSYEEIVEKGEEMHCDTVGAMLKILKNRKVLTFEGMFLMYPQNKDVMVKLLDAALL